MSLSRIVRSGSLMSRCTLWLLATTCTAPVWAGTGYEVTATRDGKQTTYMVNFGGGFNFEQHTAFDPGTKKFVYLSWPRKNQPPKPVCSIFDHQTGRTIDLYKFPDAKHPLPVIPSIEDMKVCPLTGDRRFQARPVLAYD